MGYFKRVIAWLLFFAGLIALLYIASGIFVPKDNTAEAGMEYARVNGILGEPPDSIEILVMGDSESYNGYSPLLMWKETGYTSYTCGTDAQKLTYTRTMLERALEKQHPKVVILETLAIYRPIKLDNVVLEELSRALPVFRYHDRWKDLSMDDVTEKVTATQTHPYKGHAHITNVVPCDNKEYMHPTDKAASIALVNQYYVRAIKELCDRHGAQLLLVSTPSPVNWSYERHNGIQKFADELGCTYVDMNLESVGIDWTKDTFDKGDHLNHFGAVKATKFLADYLQKQGGLTDHRADPAYSDWNQKWKEHEEQISRG